MMNLDSASDEALLKFSLKHANGNKHTELSVDRQTANILARYAAARWLARTYAREADKTTAARLETLADSLYQRLPQSARWSS